MPFKFQGKEYTDSQVRAAAQKSNMSLDDYIAKANLEFVDDSGKKKPQVMDATAGANKASAMDLQSGAGSLDLSSIKDEKANDILTGYNRSQEISDEEFQSLQEEYPSEEELYKKIKEIQSERARNYMQGLDDDDRLYAKDALSGIIFKKRGEFDSSKFVFEQVLKEKGLQLSEEGGIELDQNSELYKNTKKLEAMQSSLAAARAKGQEPSDQFFTDYNELTTLLQQQQNELNKAFVEVQKSFDKNIAAYSQVGAAFDIVDDFQRNWGTLDKFWKGVQVQAKETGAMAVEMAENGYIYMKYGSGAVGTTMINLKGLNKDKDVVERWLSQASKGLTDAAVFLGEELETDYYKKLELGEINSIDEAADYAIDTLLTNLPNTVFAATGIGVPMMFLSAGGAQLVESKKMYQEAQEVLPELRKQLEQATTEEEKSLIKSRISDYENALSTTDATRFVSAVGSGVLEAATEKAFGDIAIIDRIKKGAFGSELLKTSWKKYLGFTALSQLSEVTGEEINTLGSNYLNRELLGQNVNLFDGVTETAVDALIIGTGYGGAATTLNLTGKLMNVAISKRDEQRFYKTHQDIVKIQERLKDPNLQNKEKKFLRAEARKKAKKLGLQTKFTLEQLGRYNT
jgi:hypothetical protein